MAHKVYNCVFCGKKLFQDEEGDYHCDDCCVLFAKNDVEKNDIAKSEGIAGTDPEWPRPNKNVMEHMGICTEMNALYAGKNRDYGDSFHISFQEEGMAMARIRLGDKLNRFKTLTKNKEQQVQDESIRDTLIDLANYAIMTIMEMDRQEG